MRNARLPQNLLDQLLELGRQMSGKTADVSLVTGIVAQLGALSPSSVIRIDQSLRSFQGLFWGVTPDVWRGQQTPSLWERLVARPSLRPTSQREIFLSLLRGTPELEYVFLFHNDGFLREAALKKLSTAKSSFFVAAIALRLNDWVPSVRQAARRCGDRVLGKESPEMLAEAGVFLIGRRQEWLRGDQIRLLDDLFSRPKAIQAFVDLLSARQDGQITQAMSHALATPMLDKALLTLARGAVSPAIRLIAFRTLIEGEARVRTGYEHKWIDKAYNLTRRVPVFLSRSVEGPLSIQQLIEVAAKDSSPVVRRVAADALVKRRRELVGIEPLLDLLRSDRSQSIRQRVEFIDKDLGLEVPLTSASKAP